MDWFQTVVGAGVVFLAVQNIALEKRLREIEVILRQIKQNGDDANRAMESQLNYADMLVKQGKPPLY